MSYLGIPLAVLESTDFLELTSGAQKFLLDLYVVFADCQRFTIEMDKPEQYRQPRGTTLQRKVNKLIEANMLQVVGQTGRGGHARRVFSFVHPPLEIAEAA